jgi:hypothetical protein
MSLQLLRQLRHEIPVHVLYEGINEQLEAFLAATSEVELRTVQDFFLRMNALRVERPPLS